MKIKSFFKLLSFAFVLMLATLLVACNLNTNKGNSLDITKPVVMYTLGSGKLISFDESGLMVQGEIYVEGNDYSANAIQLVAAGDYYKIKFTDGKYLEYRLDGQNATFHKKGLKDSDNQLFKLIEENGEYRFELKLTPNYIITEEDGQYISYFNVNDSSQVWKLVNVEATFAEDVIGGTDLREDYTALTVGEAVAKAKEAGSVGTSEKFYVIGYVKTIVNPTYGEMIIEDETGELYVFGAMAKDGTFYDKMTEKPVKGDQVCLYGILMTYNDEAQMAGQGTKAEIQDFIHIEVQINPDEYKSATVAEAREAEVDSKLKVDGVVAAILYANGKVPSGFILVDETSSIHVHDGDLAAQVQVGNTIEIAASKTYWVLGTEAANAKLYGYKGACQLESAYLLSNDKGNTAYNNSWIEEKTIKEIMTTPVSENITTKLYKTTALVKKSQGTGFVNYYFNDLDGVTGSYTYTQCNGSDFAWLDEFDGKICTVYLMALNAKSSSSGCIFRLLPVTVEEAKDFSFDQSKASEFALEYAVKDLFKNTYGANPKLKLPATYSNELLGFTGVEFTYTSSATNVATFEKVENEYVMNLLAEGTATITVEAEYNNVKATFTVEVTLDPTAEIETPTISQIIEVEDGTLVQVKGVVMSSLVNREGFYIGDATGMIAVLADATTMSQIKPGDEIVVEGYKVHHRKISSYTHAGQCAIVGSIENYTDDEGKPAVSFKNNIKLLANYYGEHEYSTDYFDTTKTLDDLSGFNADDDYTTNVYVLDVKVTFVNETFYSQVKIADPTTGTELRLYCSGAAQYKWLEAYNGQTVKVEIAVCNWNDKNYYTGCIISVITENGKVLNTLNWK